MGRYGEVKSVYLCKFKSRVHHTCHHNVIVYQQGAAQLRSESIVCLLVLHTHTPEHRRYTPPRATNTSPSTLHTHLRLRLTATHKYTITIIISVQHREPLPPPIYHHALATARTRMQAHKCIAVCTQALTRAVCLID